MIYDCFMFFNELDLLEIRLHVLADVVDRFVLVESRQTHQGAQKPLHYAENMDRFAPFVDRIDHVVVDDFPDDANSPAARAIWQQNAIRVGLRDAQIGDTILISDVDEIPKPELVPAVARRGGVTIFRQLMFYYFLNCQHLRDDGTPGPVWSGTVAYRHHAGADVPYRYAQLRALRGWRGDRLSNRLRADVRRFRRFGELEGRARFVDDAGWHFSFQGGIGSIISKLKAYVHVEYNTQTFTDPQTILRAIEERRDLFGRGARYELVPVDGRFPIWLQESAGTRYRHLLAPDR